MIPRIRIRLPALKHGFSPDVLRRCFWLGLALTSSVFGQVPHLRMHYFSDDQGLYSAHVQDVVQDSAGFIWVATGDGLFKYDAYSFSGYYEDETDTSSLSSRLINCLFVDEKGTLWVGTNEGLHRYEAFGDRFTRISMVDSNASVIHPAIRQIGQDHQGNLLVRTDIQIFISKPPAMEFEPLFNFEDGVLSWFLSDPGGAIWVGFREKFGLRKYDSLGQSMQIEASPADLEFLSGLSISHMIFRDGVLWMATLGDGVVAYDTDSGELKKLPGSSWDENMVLKLYMDRSGSLWQIDYTGLKFYEDMNLRPLGFYPVEGDPESIRSGVTGILEDNQGNLWIYHNANGLGISTHGKGFNRLDSYAREFLSTRDLNVGSICEDRSGNLWIGKSDGGIRVFKWDEWIAFDLVNDPQDPYSLGRGAVLALFRDSRGTMWVGTFFDGLQYYEESTGRFISYRHDPDNPHSIAGSDIRSIVEDEDGMLWMSVHGKGIARFDPRTRKFTQFNKEENDLSNDWTFQLQFDREGGLWVGSAYGLNYLEKGSTRFRKYFNVGDDPGSLSEDFITALQVDNRGTLWVGTQKGLNRFNPGSNTFTRFLNSGRHSFISGILSDEEANLWISSRFGLLKINRENGELDEYDSYDGLQSDGYNTRACYKSQSGEFFFGGSRGIDLFRPAEIQANPTPPGIVIDQVRIQDMKALVDSTGSPVSILANPSGKLVLKPSQFMITLSFKALNFINPENNHYAVMLEGLDEDWNDMGTKREVSYTNLDAGNYIFRVRGSNNDGVWSTADAILEIKVLPRWHETWIFRIILLLVSIGVIYMFFVLRTASLRARAALLDQMVREKTGELEQKTRELEEKNSELEKSNNTKDKLMSIIAHDLVNPFNSLIGMSELLMNRIDTLSPDGRKQYTKLIYDSAQSAFALLQDLLTWARSQAGRIKYKPEILEIGAIIHDIMELNRGNMEAKSIRFEIDCQDDVRVYGDREMISTVLRNLVNNAIKFVPREGEISISARKEDDSVNIEVRDNGIGMSPEKISEILDSTTVDSSPGTDGEKGSGLGLSLSKEFIRQHGGELRIRSEVYKGSTFSFNLPADNNPRA